VHRVIEQAGDGLIGLQVVTLDEFVRGIAEDSFLQDERRILPPLLAPFVMRQLLHDEGSEHYFAALAAQPGFLRNLLTTLQELKHTGITPSDLKTFLERAQLTEANRQKLVALASLYSRYSAFLLDSHFYDEGDLYERAASLLADENDTTPLFFYGFSGFTALQRRVVEAIVKERDTLAFFPWREGTAHEVATATLGWLRELGFQQTQLQTMPSTYSQLQRLPARLFEPVSFWGDESQAQLDQSVMLLSAANASQEVREVARAIFTLVRERHMRFDEIAVLLPTATYEPLVRETLTALGIPSTFANEASLLTTRAGQSALLLCQILLDDYARTRVLEFLQVTRPPFAALIGALADHAHVARWDILTREVGIVRSLSQWRLRLAQLQARVNVTDAIDPFDTEEVVDHDMIRALVAFMERFLTDAEQLPRVNSWNGWVEQMHGLMATYVSPSTHTDQVTAVLQQLGQLHAFTAQISLREWTRAVREALALTLAAPTEGDTSCAVFVGDLRAARGLSFRAVIIPGMLEGEFPQAVRQDPILLDSERQYISEILLCDLRQRNRIVEEERNEFTLAVQSATEYLLFTYARQEQASGRMQLPSSYLLRVVEALSGRFISLPELRDWCVSLPLLPLGNGSPMTALDAIEFHCAKVAQAQETHNPAVLGYLPATMPFFTSALTALHQRWDVSHLTPFDGMLAEETVKQRVHSALFPTSLRLSPSALETYARCPFRYFLGALLGLTPQDDLETLATIRARDRGILLHDVLYEFLTRLRREQRLPLQAHDHEHLARILSEITEKHFAVFSTTKMIGLPLMWELEQERLRTQLAQFLQWEVERGGTFVPATFEAAFGQENTERESQFFPSHAVPFPLDQGGELFLHGRIDRIDIARDSQQARILDYKSGKKLSRQFAGGTALQLPLYFFAARLLRPDLDWISAEYVALHSANRKETKPVFAADTWPAVSASLQTLVSLLVEGIETGCFATSPETCRPCPFPLICGANAESLATRKREDKRLAGLLRARQTP
jgi:ATP-dependent helicase/DNAse subunit B